MKEKLTRIIVETPKGSSQKFDFEPEQNVFVLNKIMPSGTVFPFDFGFIPGTLGADGDPLDVMVLSESGTFTGCAVDCRIIGVITATQREQDGNTTENDRFIGIPAISKLYKHIQDINELDKELLEQLKHFFISYNEQAGKVFNITGTLGPVAAQKRIDTGIRKNNRQDILIQLFLPIKSDQKFSSLLDKYRKMLTDKFGGISIYAQSPVDGFWKETGRHEKNELIVIEIMAGNFEDAFWKKLKSELETDMEEKEILIRWMQAVMLKDN